MGKSIRVTFRLRLQRRHTHVYNYYEFVCVSVPIGMYGKFIVFTIEKFQAVTYYTVHIYVQTFKKKFNHIQDLTEGEGVFIKKYRQYLPRDCRIKDATEKNTVDYFIITISNRYIIIPIIIIIFVVIM